MPVQPGELVTLFARNVRRRRVELGMTQEQLAEKLGTAFTYISALERGTKTPWLKNLAPIAEALETTPDALLADDNPPPRKKVAARS